MASSDKIPTGSLEYSELQIHNSLLSFHFSETVA